GLPPRARGARGVVPAARENRGRPQLIRAGARAHAAGTGAAVSRATPGRAPEVTTTLSIHVVNYVVDSALGGTTNHRGSEETYEVSMPRLPRGAEAPRGSRQRMHGLWRRAQEKRPADCRRGARADRDRHDGAGAERENLDHR